MTDEHHVTGRSEITEKIIKSDNDGEEIDSNSDGNIEDEIHGNVTNKNKKKKKHIHGFEIGDPEDPFGDHDNYNSVTNHDYEPPCPSVSSSCPYCVIILCCCCWSKYDRQQCALALLYTRFYLVLYVLTILITIGLLIYDLSNGSIANSNLDKEPIWFISLDIFCVALMVFDIVIQIQANISSFFKSILNWIDFVIVISCVVSIPIYWIAPDWILSIVLLSRFIVRMLRVFTIIRHQKFRKEYIDARDTIVDFTQFDEAKNVNQAATKSYQEFM